MWNETNSNYNAVNDGQQTNNDYQFDVQFEEADEGVFRLLPQLIQPIIPHVVDLLPRPPSESEINERTLALAYEELRHLLRLKKTSTRAQILQEFLYQYYGKRQFIRRRLVHKMRTQNYNHKTSDLDELEDVDECVFEKIQAPLFFTNASGKFTIVNPSATAMIDAYIKDRENNDSGMSSCVAQGVGSDPSTDGEGNKDIRQVQDLAEDKEGRARIKCILSQLSEDPECSTSSCTVNILGDKTEVSCMRIRYCHGTSRLCVMCKLNPEIEEMSTEVPDTIPHDSGPIKFVWS